MTHAQKCQVRLRTLDKKCMSISIGICAVICLFFLHRLSLSLIISQFSQTEIPSEKDKMYIAYAQIIHCVIAVWFNIYKVNRAVAQSQICIPSFSIQLARITSSLIILEIT